MMQILKVRLNSVQNILGKPSFLLLRDINFDLDYGKVYTIIGRNGAGKSTLIKAVSGLPDSSSFIIEGESVFEGKDLFTCDEGTLDEIRRKKLKYVFQDAPNVFDNLKKLKYYFDDTGASLPVITKELDGFLLPPPDKIFAMYPYQLSGGMAQRCAAALAFLYSPRLVIMDEPNSALDPAVSNLILLKIKDFTAAGGTVLLVTQDLQFARKCSDFTALLSEGTLSPFFSAEEFFEAPESHESKLIVEAFKRIKNGFTSG